MGKRIAFVGAGALGGYVGGYFARAGEDVTLIDPWPEHIETIRRQGLELTGLTPAPRGETQIAVTFEIDSDGIFNVRARDIKNGNETVARIQLVGAQSAPADIEAMQARQAAHPLAPAENPRRCPAIRAPAGPADRPGATTAPSPARSSRWTWRT